MLSLDSPELEQEVKLRVAFLAAVRLIQAWANSQEDIDDGANGTSSALKRFLKEINQLTPHTDQEYDLLIEDEPSSADHSAIEVKVLLRDGTERWCFFMTPETLRNAGDFIPGTEVRVHWGEPHMFIVSQCTADTIEAVIRSVVREGELYKRTLAC